MIRPGRNISWGSPADTLSELGTASINSDTGSSDGIMSAVISAKGLQKLSGESPRSLSSELLFMSASIQSEVSRSCVLFPAVKIKLFSPINHVGRDFHPYDSKCD